MRHPQIFSIAQTPQNTKALNRIIYLQYRALRFRTHGRIRTPDLLIRSQTLYPAELRAQNSERFQI